MKKSVMVNLMPEVLKILELETRTLDVSRNVLIESSIITYAYKSKVILNEQDVVGIIDSFQMKRGNKITANFRNAIKELPSTNQWELCTFFSELNLIENIKVTTQRMANLWKNEELICYFAFGKIAGRNIEDILKNKKVITIGTTKENKPAYYLSNLQQLKIPTNYPKWNNLLALLNVEPCEVIRVDTESLFNIILPALRQLK